MGRQGRGQSEDFKMVKLALLVFWVVFLSNGNTSPHHGSVSAAMDASVTEHANYEEEEITATTASQRNLGIEDWGEYMNYTQGLATFNENLDSSSISNNDTFGIIDGGDASFFPWVVHFASKICMGSLIAPDRVLTSATCIQVGDVPSFVRVGPTTQFNGALGTVRCAKTHPSYSRNGNTIANDVAVLKLQEPITTRQPVQLNLDTNYPGSEPNLQLHAFGFGFDDFASFPSRLQDLEYEYLPTGDCQTVFPEGVVQSNAHLCGLANKEGGLCSGKLALLAFVRLKKNGTCFLT